MKTIKVLALLVAFAAVMCLPSQGQAQVTVATSKAYANSAVHVLSFNVPNAGVYTKLSLLLHFKDSCSVVVGCDARMAGASTWTGIDSVTYTSTVNAGVYKEYVVRDNVTSNAGGPSCEVRFHLDFAGSANGVTSATYDAVIYAYR